MELPEQNKPTGGQGGGRVRIPGAGQELERDRMGQILQKLCKKWEGKEGRHGNTSETGWGWGSPQIESRGAQLSDHDVPLPEEGLELGT